MGFREEIHPGVDLYPCSRTRVLPPTIERRIKRATNLQVRDPAASHQLWSELDHDLVDRAPWVALGNTIWTSLVSERLGKYQSTRSTDSCSTRCGCADRTNIQWHCGAVLYVPAPTSRSARSSSDQRRFRRAPFHRMAHQSTNRRVRSS